MADAPIEMEYMTLYLDLWTPGGATHGPLSPLHGQPVIEELEIKSGLRSDIDRVVRAIHGNSFHIVGRRTTKVDVTDRVLGLDSETGENKP